jgi:hypothetical protein
MSLQCTIPLLYISFYCALPPSSHLNHTQQQPHRSLLCSTFLSSLCSLCMQYAPSSCMLSPCHCSPHRGIFSHFPLPQLSSLKPLPLSLSYISSSCRVLYLIIIATLQLLWWFNPRVQSLGVMLSFLSLSGS